MKKLVYSLLVAGLSLVGCTSFDDPVQEKYAAGPSVDIQISETADSTFTVTVTPAAGAQYYSYIVMASSKVQQLDATTLLKNAYSGTVAGEMVETAKAASTTNKMRNKKDEPLCLPNTTYQVYAVAVSDKGITGEIANASVTTTDGLAPKPQTLKADTKNKSVDVTFSEAVTRGEGEIVAMYYKEWDLANPVVINAEDLKITIKDNVVTFAAPNSYAGAFVTVSWAEGAFIDSYGNKCSALNSGLNMTTGKFTGVNFRNDLVPFDLQMKTEAEEAAETEEEKSTGNLTVEPEIGSSFAKSNDFLGKLTIDFNVHRNPATVKAGDIQMIYSNSNKSTTLNLSSDYWVIKDNQVLFVLPDEAPQYGDYLSLVVNEGAITDVYGNPNKKFVIEKGWLYSYGYKREMILGNHILPWESNWGGIYQENLTIEADPDSKDGVIIKGFLSSFSDNFPITEVAPIKAIFNGDYATLTIPNSEEPIYADESREIYFKNGNGYDKTTAVVNKDGTFTINQYWGYYMHLIGTSKEGWFDAAIPGATSVKSEETAQSAVASSFSSKPFVPTIKSANRILK